MGIGEILDAVKDAILLTERVEKLGNDVTELTQQIRSDAKEYKEDYRDLNQKYSQISERLVRVESLLEYAQQFGSRNKKIESHV